MNDQTSSDTSEEGGFTSLCGLAIIKNITPRDDPDLGEKVKPVFQGPVVPTSSFHTRTDRGIAATLEKPNDIISHHTNWRSSGFTETNPSRDMLRESVIWTSLNIIAVCYEVEACFLVLSLRVLNSFKISLLGTKRFVQHNYPFYGNVIMARAWAEISAFFFLTMMPVLAIKVHRHHSASSLEYLSAVWSVHVRVCGEMNKSRESKRLTAILNNWDRNTMHTDPFPGDLSSWRL